MTVRTIFLKVAERIAVLETSILEDIQALFYYAFKLIAALKPIAVKLD